MIPLYDRIRHVCLVGGQRSRAADQEVKPRRPRACAG